MTKAFTALRLPHPQGSAAKFVSIFERRWLTLHLPNSIDGFASQAGTQRLTQGCGLSNDDSSWGSITGVSLLF